MKSVASAFPQLDKGPIRVLQFNIGRLCNQACRHCHVDSSPIRKGPADNASPELLQEVKSFLAAHPAIDTLDITGGAPELNPGFRDLVRFARELGRTVLVRHNLTVQMEEGQEDLPEFFRQQGVQLYCSLPCYMESNVNQQRGDGVFAKSIAALRRLNQVGFGVEESCVLNLVYNPIGPNLPPAQKELEEAYRQHLAEEFGLHFHHLLTITNQPIHRFRESLQRSGGYNGYMDLLRQNFNPSTMDALMCREAISLRWDGQLFDCDFHLVQGLAMRNPQGQVMTLQDLSSVESVRRLEGTAVQVADHCFACTAGAGSSCGGALVV